MTEKKWYDNAVMVNRDPNWYGATRGANAEESRANLAQYFSQYEGAVTDVLICVLEQTSIIPSKYIMWRGDKVLQKTENGHEVDYSNMSHLYKAYAEYGVDGVEVFIEEVNKLGIRPWITLRMNDVHFGANETSFLRPDIYYEAKEAGEMVGPYYNYYATAHNFKYPRYREALLGYIGEILDKYDMFGLELDFMREIYCFDYFGNPDGIQEIMLDFMREVKKMAIAAEKRIGHDLKISIRTCRDSEDAYIFGFDIKRMVDEGLVDVVVVTPHFATTDSGMPIRKWKELLGEGAAVMAGLEMLNGYPSAVAHSSPENAKAYAAAYYEQGADGIYFNNHEYYTDHNRACWRVNRDNCYEGRRDFVVTYQDCAAYPIMAYKPLPFRIGYSNILPLEVGKIKSTDKVTLLIDFDGEKFPEISISGFRANSIKVVEPLTLYDFRGNPVYPTPHTPLEFDFTGFETDGKAFIGFIGNGGIGYIRLTVISE